LFEGESDALAGIAMIAMHIKDAAEAPQPRANDLRAGAKRR
jgi:hypothetical protein